MSEAHGASAAGAPDRGSGAALRGAMATAPRSASQFARLRLAQPNGWWGMALFLCAEATLFGGLITTYFYLNFNAPQWPPAGVRAPGVVTPIVLTGILVATSVPIALASRAARAGALRPCLLLIVLAMAVQAGYVSYQLHLFVGEVHRFPPQHSAYSSIYFTMLGFHHAHVILGILLSAGIALWLLASGLTNYRLVGVRALALYWHVVNAIAVAVLLTQISPKL